MPARGLENLGGEVDRLIQQFEANRSDEAVPEWILPDPSCDFLQSLAALLAPPVHAFEFGSGRSTHALRRASVATISVEHSTEWLRETETVGAKRESDQTFVIPLRRCWNRFRPVESFDIHARGEVLDQLRRSNLILIDSPPNPAKREHVLFLALQYAPIGALIVLDDLEVRAVRNFSTRLARQNRDAFRFWRVSIDHGLGVFLKIHSGRIRSLPSLRNFVGTWLRA
jgi:hypothetical protein